MSIRQYDFSNVGIETGTQPSTGTPSAGTDLITKTYADGHYKQGALAVADIAALKAIAAADRSDNDERYVDAEQANFAFDSASSTTGDDLTVVQPTSGTGRWFRVNRDPVIASTASYRNQAESRYYEQTANGTNYVGFKAPDLVTANKIWKLPNGDGAASQVLSTDGSGALSWSSVATAERTVNTTAIASTTTIGTSSADVRVLSHTAAFDLTLDNTFSAGRELYLINEGTADVTLKANDASVIATIYRQTSYRVMCRSTTPTTNTSWIGLTPINSPAINISSLVSFTGLGTPSTIEAFMWRTGSRVRMAGWVEAGTTSSTTLAMILPSGIVINSSTPYESAHHHFGMWGTHRTSSWMTAGDGGAVTYISGSGTDRVCFVKLGNDDSWTAMAANSAVSTGQTFSFNFEFEVSGWSVNKG